MSTEQVPPPSLIGTDSADAEVMAKAGALENLSEASSATRYVADAPSRKASGVTGLRANVKLFGRFAIERVLSRYGDEIVVLCRDTCPKAAKAGHLCDKALSVLKITARDGWGMERPEYRFLRQTALALRVKSPYVVKTHEYHIDNCFVGFSMEYLAGGSLREHIGADGIPRYATIARLLLQIAHGLCGIHQTGTIHRDIKPDNILLTASGVPKISDFGISIPKHCRFPQDTDELTGTVAYLAPEYIRTGCFDERADIYAFGVMAYELISGRLPFSNENPLSALIQKATRTPPPITEYRADCPAELWEPVRRALARDPEHRFQSARELRGALLSGVSQLLANGKAEAFRVPALLSA